MQIVIEVNEKDFEFLKQSDGARYSRTIIEAVINGTPLPKGHGRLIDADKLTESTLCKTFGLRGVDIENAPTIVEADKEESEE